MKVAIPVVQGKLAMHFGHSQSFSLVEIDEATKGVIGSTSIIPPAHEPGVLPKWLHEQGADVIITGGMGMRAQQFFQEYGIKVVVGAPVETPEKVAELWIKGQLVTGGNICDH